MAGFAFVIPLDSVQYCRHERHYHHHSHDDSGQIGAGTDGGRWLRFLAALRGMHNLRTLWNERAFANGGACEVGVEGGWLGVHRGAQCGD